MLYFFDSSALVKRYVRESGTDWVLALMTPDSAAKIAVANITLVEIVAAVRRRQHGGALSAAAASALLADCHRDFARHYQVMELTAAMVHRAVIIADTHALRANDALQLAAAVEARSECFLLQVPLKFVCADGELGSAARAEGLDVDNPEDH